MFCDGMVMLEGWTKIAVVEEEWEYQEGCMLVIAQEKGVWLKGKQIKLCNNLDLWPVMRGKPIDMRHSFYMTHRRVVAELCMGVT